MSKPQSLLLGLIVAGVCVLGAAEARVMPNPNVGPQIDPLDPPLVIIKPVPKPPVVIKRPRPKPPVVVKRPRPKPPVVIKRPKPPKPRPQNQPPVRCNPNNIQPPCIIPAR